MTIENSSLELNFKKNYALQVNFLQYYGLLNAIPSIWKRSFSDPLQTNKVAKNNLSPSNVTAKLAREHENLVYQRS